MGPWLTRDQDGRWRIDLHRLPLGIRLGIALAVVAIVVVTARLMEPNPAIPDWLGRAIHVGGWIYLGIVALLLGRWLWRR